MTAKNKKTISRIITLLFGALVLWIGSNYTVQNNSQTAILGDSDTGNLTPAAPSDAGKALAALPIKGRAAKTGYDRSLFGRGWNNTPTCDVRNDILARDLVDERLDTDNCTVLNGTLYDPYTGKTILFVRGETTSDDVQIDHVVAISDAWQKGAQQLSALQRNQFANDPLNLLAVDGPTNNNKGDGDAATWLPPKVDYRCSYVARQVAVKTKYSLWVTRAEYDAINTVLSSCPDQTLPTS